MRLLTGFDKGGHTPAHGNPAIGMDSNGDNVTGVDPKYLPGPRLHYRLRRPISWSFVAYAAWKAVVWWSSSNNRSSEPQYRTLTEFGRSLPGIGPGHPMFLWAILWTLTAIYLAYSLLVMTREAATRGLLTSAAVFAGFSFSLSYAAVSGSGNASYDTLGTLLLIEFFHVLALYLTWAEW